MDRVQILKIIILIPEIGTEKEAANVYDAVEVHFTLTAIIQSIYPKNICSVKIWASLNASATTGYGT